MRWNKLGRIFCPENNYPWMVSHAANPVAECDDDPILRIYFSTRDVSNRSSVGWVEIDRRNPLRVIRISPDPVIAPGPIGAFDDSGCSIGCIVAEGARRWLYYMGWNLGVTVPWRNAIGLAVSDAPGEPFRKISLAPIMDRSGEDPFTLSYPWVLKSADGWRMWYGSNFAWGGSKQDMDHRLKHAFSENGIAWRRDGKVAVEPADASEYAFARPCVVRDADRWRMWYAYRGAAYRLGYAESEDGIRWQRRDEQVGITVSADGWDTEMIEYPCIFDAGGERYMLYNGNGYGRTGFGLAVLDQD